MAARVQYSPYAELGVSPGASPREVRRAFLKIARRFHPDKCDAPGAGERFRRAQEAFASITRACAGKQPVAAAAAAARAAEADSAACASDSDSWEPPPLPKPKPAQPPEAVDPDEPVLCLAELLELLRRCAAAEGDSEGGAPSQSSLRRRFLQAAVRWPWDLSGAALRADLARLLRDELDARVAAMELGRLSKQDLGWWLEARGCSVRFALEDDSVGKDALARLAREQLSAGRRETPLPELGEAKAPSSPSGCKAGSKAEAEAEGGSKRLAVALSARPGKKLRPAQENLAPLAKEEDYDKWLQQAIKRGNARQGAQYLLEQAETGDVFRGKRLAVKPFRAAAKRLGLDLGPGGK